MDRDLSTTAMMKQKMKSLYRIGLFLIIIIIGLLAFRALLEPELERSTLLTAVAEIGSIEAAITASGTVVPEFEQIITSPIQSRIDSVYLKPGEKANTGDAILALNKESIQNDFEKLHDKYELEKNKKVQHELDIERQLIDLDAEQDIKKLKIKSLEAQLKQEQRLYEIGGGSKNAVDKAELDFEIAKRELNQLKRQISNLEKSLTADRKQLDLEIRIQKNNMDNLKRQVELAEAKAGRSGVVTWVNEDLGSAVNKGDVLAKIADLNSFKVEARISEIHAEKLKLGSPVNVRINDVDLKGTISNIQPTIEKGIITFLVKLADKQSPMLRSNLRVDVFVITSFKNDVVRVKNGAYVNGSGSQNIFVIEGSKAIRRNVLVGAANFDYVEMTNNISPGDTVIISNMNEYIHHDKIDLE